MPRRTQRPAKSRDLDESPILGVCEFEIVPTDPCASSADNGSSCPPAPLPAIHDGRPSQPPKHPSNRKIRIRVKLMSAQMPAPFVIANPAAQPQHPQPQHPQSHHSQSHHSQSQHSQVARTRTNAIGDSSALLCCSSTHSSSTIATSAANNQSAFSIPVSAASAVVSSFASGALRRVSTQQSQSSVYSSQVVSPLVRLPTWKRASLRSAEVGEGTELSLLISTGKERTIEDLAHQIEAEYAARFFTNKESDAALPTCTALFRGAEPLLFGSRVGESLRSGDVVTAYNYIAQGDADGSESDDEPVSFIPILSAHARKPSDSLSVMTLSNVDMSRVSGLIARAPLKSRFINTLTHPVPLRAFLEFCALPSELSLESLLFVLDVERFRHVQPTMARLLANYIYLSYIAPCAPLRINVSNNMRENIAWPFLPSWEYNPWIFDEVLASVGFTLKKHTLLRFERSPVGLVALMGQPEFRADDYVTPLEYDLLECDPMVAIADHFAPDIDVILWINELDLDANVVTSLSALSTSFREQLLERVTAQFVDPQRAYYVCDGYFRILSHIKPLQKQRKIRKTRKIRNFFGDDPHEALLRQQLMAIVPPSSHVSAARAAAELVARKNYAQARRRAQTPSHSRANSVSSSILAEQQMLAIDSDSDIERDYMQGWAFDAMRRPQSKHATNGWSDTDSDGARPAAGRRHNRHATYRGYNNQTLDRALSMIGVAATAADFGDAHTASSSSLASSQSSALPDYLASIDSADIFAASNQYIRNAATIFERKRRADKLREFFGHSEADYFHDTTMYANDRSANAPANSTKCTDQHGEPLAADSYAHRTGHPLTPSQRNVLVRRRRKLRAMLGEHVGEDLIGTSQFVHSSQNCAFGEIGLEFAASPPTPASSSAASVSDQSDDAALGTKDAQIRQFSKIREILGESAPPPLLYSPNSTPTPDDDAPCSAQMSDAQRLRALWRRDKLKRVLGDVPEAVTTTYKSDILRANIRDSIISESDSGVDALRKSRSAQNAVQRHRINKLRYFFGQSIRPDLIFSQQAHATPAAALDARGSHEFVPLKSPHKPAPQPIPSAEKPWDFALSDDDDQTTPCFSPKTADAMRPSKDSGSKLVAGIHAALSPAPTLAQVAPWPAPSPNVPPHVSADELYSAAAPQSHAEHTSPLPRPVRAQFWMTSSPESQASIISATTSTTTNDKNGARRTSILSSLKAHKASLISSIKRSSVIASVSGSAPKDVARHTPPQPRTRARAPTHDSQDTSKSRRGSAASTHNASSSALSSKPSFLSRKSSKVTFEFNSGKKHTGALRESTIKELAPLPTISPNNFQASFDRGLALRDIVAAVERLNCTSPHPSPRTLRPNMPADTESSPMRHKAVPEKSALSTGSLDHQKVISAVLSLSSHAQTIERLDKVASKPAKIAGYSAVPSQKSVHWFDANSTPPAPPTSPQCYSPSRKPPPPLYTPRSPTNAAACASSNVPAHDSEPAHTDSHAGSMPPRKMSGDITMSIVLRSPQAKRPIPQQAPHQFPIQSRAPLSHKPSVTAVGGRRAFIESRAVQRPPASSDAHNIVTIRARRSHSFAIQRKISRASFGRKRSNTIGTGRQADTASHTANAHAADNPFDIPDKANRRVQSMIVSPQQLQRRAAFATARANRDRCVTVVPLHVELQTLLMKRLAALGRAQHHPATHKTLFPREAERPYDDLRSFFEQVALHRNGHARALKPPLTVRGEYVRSRTSSSSSSFLTASSFISSPTNPFRTRLAHRKDSYTLRAGDQALRRFRSLNDCKGLRVNSRGPASGHAEKLRPLRRARSLGNVRYRPRRRPRSPQQAYFQPSAGQRYSRTSMSSHSAASPSSPLFYTFPRSNQRSSQNGNSASCRRLSIALLTRIPPSSKPLPIARRSMDSRPTRVMSSYNTTTLKRHASFGSRTERIPS